MPDFDFDAIGTRWRIRTVGPLTAGTIGRLQRRIEDFDRTYSRFREDSLVTQFSQRTGSQQFPSDVVPLLRLYRQLYALTQGGMSPLVGRALEHLGYDAAYSLQRTAGSLSVPAWDDALAVDGAVLTARRPVLLDVGAAGKGYLVDLLARILRADGIDDYLIDASGDLAHRGDDPCRVGLESPLDPTTAIGIANLSNGALCASATNRRRWADGTHHIISAATAEPVSEVIASWVVADSALVADGLATALFLTEPSALAPYFAFSFVRMLRNGAVEYSSNFDGELFL